MILKLIKIFYRNHIHCSVCNDWGLICRFEKCQDYKQTGNISLKQYRCDCVRGLKYKDVSDLKLITEANSRIELYDTVKEIECLVDGWKR